MQENTCEIKTAAGGEGEPVSTVASHRAIHLMPGDQRRMPVSPTLLCPYHNRWGEPAYRFDAPFEHRPLCIHASSTSGSPAIEDGLGRFIGVLDFAIEDAGTVRFTFDGQAIEVHNDGQRPIELYVGDEPAAPGQHWRAYNRLLGERLPPARPTHDFWYQHEYCTWVEQKWVALQNTSHQGGAQRVLDDAFIDRYIEQIHALGLPPGKLTIDHGWQHGDETYGDWLPHPERFADLGRTADRIAAAGFTPGIWLAPIWLHPHSQAARDSPDSLGEPIAPSNADSPQQGDWRYWRPTDAMAERLREVFARLYQQGFRKFKFDMTYARMDLMIRLHEIIYRVVREVAPDAEVETHHPNPFFAIHTDAVRTNDVLCNADQDWRTLTRDHFDICERSAFGRLINLDHIGGNDAAVTEADYLSHLELYRDAVGYPVVSLLPHHLGQQAVEAVRDLLKTPRPESFVRSNFVEPPVGARINDPSTVTPQGWT